MEEGSGRYRMGWLPDIPDIRDFTPFTDNIRQDLLKTGVDKAGNGDLPKAVGLRKWCSPVEDQGRLGSCTAHAGVGMVEYFERKAYGKHIDASRLFLYKVTRKLQRSEGDSGASIRAIMGALRVFGVPPEEYWPYDIRGFDKEPTPFCYAFAQNYQSVKYYRLDPPGTNRDELVHIVRKHLATQLPAMFGFTVYDSIDDGYKGQIPFPSRRERASGGHAVVAVGYDDELSIERQDGTKDIGAFLIRNSWGKDWGDGGYGWLPYEYIRRGLAQDFWSIISQEWVDTDEFGFLG